MAKKTHKISSKKSTSAKTPARRRTSPASKTKKLSKSVRKSGNGADVERRVEKANALLQEACQIMYEIRTGKRKAKEPSLKWLKSLMMRTSV